MRDSLNPLHRETARPLRKKNELGRGGGANGTARRILSLFRAPPMFGRRRRHRPELGWGGYLLVDEDLHKLASSHGRVIPLSSASFFSLSIHRFVSNDKREIDIARHGGSPGPVRPTNEPGCAGEGRWKVDGADRETRHAWFQVKKAGGDVSGKSGRLRRNQTVAGGGQRSTEKQNCTAVNERWVGE